MTPLWGVFNGYRRVFNGYFDPLRPLLYPGAAGARELAHRAPGAIILGGGCEWFEFF